MMSLFSHINEIVPLLFFLNLFIYLSPNTTPSTVNYFARVHPSRMSNFPFFLLKVLFLSLVFIFIHHHHFFFRLELYSYILSFPLSSPIIPVRMKNNGRCHRVVKVSLRPPTHLCVCVPISPLASSRRAQYKYKANQNKYLYRFNN